MAGFAFKSNTTVSLDNNPQLGTLASKVYTNAQAAGLVGAGQQVTAIGGFVFDSNGNGVAAATIKVCALANCTTAPSYTINTMGDGFYIVPVADGTKWWVGAYAPSSGPLLSGRFIDHRLAKKEFDEEDFYVNWP
jgi:hypothetical protein